MFIEIMELIASTLFYFGLAYYIFTSTKWITNLELRIRKLEENKDVQ